MAASDPHPPSFQTPLSNDIQGVGFGIGRQRWLGSEACFARTRPDRGMDWTGAEAVLVPLCCHVRRSYGVRRASAATH